MYNLVFLITLAVVPIVALLFLVRIVNKNVPLRTKEEEAGENVCSDCGRDDLPLRLDLDSSVPSMVCPECLSVGDDELEDDPSNVGAVGEPNE